MLSELDDLNPTPTDYATAPAPRSSSVDVAAYLVLYAIFGVAMLGWVLLCISAWATG